MTRFPSEVIKYIPERHRALAVQEMEPPPLDWLGEVALLFREMPYGKLMAFCDATGADHAFLWEWCNGRL